MYSFLDVKSFFVSKLTCTTRLINLIADDNAIEDTIYHLHRALNAGRIDLERFLRVSMAKIKKNCRIMIRLFLTQSTRVLAEEQFMKRALIEKIQTSVSTMSSSSIALDWS